MKVRCYRPHGFPEEIDAHWFLPPLMIALGLLALVFLLPLDDSHRDEPGRSLAATAQSRTDQQAGH